MEQARRQDFTELLAEPGRGDALERGALLIAGRGRPQLAVAEQIRRIEELAQAAQAQVETGTAVAAAQLGAYLCREEGFQGNLEDYYDPANSYLDQVLSRRLGIPITLAVIYIAVGRRLGVPLHGVGFPGHVLVGGDGPVLLDPFTGQHLDNQDCERLAKRLFGRAVALQPEWFAPLSPQAMWFRMLGNLRRIFMERGAFQTALEYCDWQLLIEPRAAQELLDRGLLLEQLGQTSGAHAALRHFLLLHPQHRAAPAVRVKLRELGRDVGQRWLH